MIPVIHRVSKLVYTKSQPCIILCLTRMRRQSDEKSWWAGMVENTERTRQLNTKMNLKHKRRRSETGDAHQRTGWHQRSDLCSHHMTTFPMVTNMLLITERALSWNCLMRFPLLQTLEPTLATRAEPEQKNLAAQSHNLQYTLSTVNHEPDYYSISWDIKLIMLVCVMWFARSKQQNCGCWKTSNIRPFPHTSSFAWKPSFSI